MVPAVGRNRKRGLYSDPVDTSSARPTKVVDVEHWVLGLHRDTVRKMLEYSVPHGYRWRKLPIRPKIGPYTGVIDRTLKNDLNLPKKQRYTAKRIHDRLKDEYDSGCSPSTSLGARRNICEKFSR